MQVRVLKLLSALRELTVDAWYEFILKVKYHLTQKTSIERSTDEAIDSVTQSHLFMLASD